MKHVGRHGDKKVLILWRTVPDEEHMCLVSYSDKMPSFYHDAVMKVLESGQGQEAAQLADALHRNLLPDGRNILNTLHREGLIKKVQTAQVIVTPDPKNSVRLDELNKILQEMSQGQDAVRRMAEIDAQAGRRDPKKSAALNSSTRTADALSDSNLANNLRQQAERMAAEARGLLAESERLMAQAGEMSSSATASLTEAEQMRLAKKEAGKKVARRRRNVVRN
jgi:hypothetical protein